MLNQAGWQTAVPGCCTMQQIGSESRMNRTVFQYSKERRSYCVCRDVEASSREHEIRSNTYTWSRRERGKHEKRLKEIGGGMNFNGHASELETQRLKQREREKAGVGDEDDATTSKSTPFSLILSIDVYLLPSPHFLQRLCVCLSACYALVR